MQYRMRFETEHGTTTTRERDDPASYTAEVTVKVRVPKPHRDLAEVMRLNAALPEVLPGLSTLLETAKVSPAFDDLYRLKCALLENNLRRLDTLLTRHNFYDCETILELQHAQTKRRALFIQADMDVDTDGSDPDRVPEVEGASTTFQPFTSYQWDRKTDNPSSFIPPREAKIRQYETELAAGVSPARREELKAAQAQLRVEIANLREHRFLVGAVDPFIVLPGSMFGKNKRGPYAPSVGDYCVVIHQRTLYPAIVGDVGPRTLQGEASLRLCKQINPAANATNRPTNELRISYIVFPGTAEKFDAPDLPKWQARCAALLDELGGHQGVLFAWEDLTKPKPTPAPPPTPTPSPTPAPTTTPAASPTATPQPR